MPILPRDFEKEPYSAAEAKIAAFFAARGVGGGDDPVGAILACHAYVIEQRNTLREALRLARGDLLVAVSDIDRELKNAL